MYNNLQRRPSEEVFWAQEQIQYQFPEEPELIAQGRTHISRSPTNFKKNFLNPLREEKKINYEKIWLI